MVLPAADTLILTNKALLYQSSTDLQTEVSLAENRIRSAAGLGLYSTTYNATIIGNPQVDPRLTVDLPPLQLQFYQIFIEAGYTVSVDPATGYWAFAWGQSGIETLVQIYTFRTIFDPTAILEQTKIVIENFFAALVPTVHCEVSYNANIDETTFGGVTSDFYEFTIVTDQQDPNDLSSGLRLHMASQGLGYTMSNCMVWRLAV